MYFQLLLIQFKQKQGKSSEALDTNTNATDFQGCSEMTLKIKMHLSPFLERGFQKFFSCMENYLDKLKMIK